MLLVAMIVAVSALPKRDPPRLPKPSGNPNFGGYGSFNPRGVSFYNHLHSNHNFVGLEWVELIFLCFFSATFTR